MKFRCQDEWSCECGKTHRIPLQKVLLKNNLLDNIEDAIDDLNLGKQCIIVEDAITRSVVGTRAKEGLEAAGYEVSEEIVDRADDSNVERVRKKIGGFEFALAVGGGTPIDVTKIATYEENIPFISFPTAMSHDGIASPIASITTNGVKGS